jgi:hypothetical protein
MPPDSDPASKAFGAWARAHGKVKVHDDAAAKVDVTETRGGADGGAGRTDEMPLKPPPDPNETIRQAIAIRKMQKQGF